MAPCGGRVGSRVEPVDDTDGAAPGRGLPVAEEGCPMDEAMVQRINELVEEEHRLHGHASAGHPLSDEDRARLRDLEVELDQCWDLLRQRRARRAAGQDPNAATVRPAEVVEHYQQ